MPIGHAPHGFSVYGVPIMPGGGGARFAGWWGTSYFVDYDHGNDGNTGLEPTDAYLNLQTAITAASGNGDVIYIRNRDQDTATTDPEFIIPASTTNWSVAQAKVHLSIIGAANTSHIPCQEAGLAVYLRGHATANTTAIMDWQGAFGLIENLAFHRGASTAGGLLALTGNSTSLRALGTVVNNCLFRLSNHAVGALYNVDNWFVTVYNCIFHDCKFGVEFHGSSSTIRRSAIVGCTFRNQTAASVDTNILINGSSTQDVTVRDCIFTCQLGTGGTNKYINFTAAATGAIYNCSFPTDVTLGTQVRGNSAATVGSWEATSATAGLLAGTS